MAPEIWPLIVLVTEFVLTNKTFHITVFLILCAVTHFRKELSANNEYMSDEKEDDDILSEESARIEAAARKVLKSSYDDITKLYKIAQVKARLRANTPSSENLQKLLDLARSSELVLENLPHDILFHCATFLSLSDMLTSSMVSPSLKLLMDRPLVDSASCVWRELWKLRFGDLWQSGEFRSAARRHGCLWDPLYPKAELAPAGGWCRFFFDFDACWLDWCLVGHNRTPQKRKDDQNDDNDELEIERKRFKSNETINDDEMRCLMGLYGSVYDVTDFLDDHPGSKETLLDNAGGDATWMFEDVGHSNVARRLLPSLLVLPSPHPLSRNGGPTGGQRAQSKRRLQLSCSRAMIGPEARDKVLRTASLVSPSSCGCNARQSHVGVCRVFYDPFTKKWGSWWTCCDSRSYDL